MRRSVCIYMKWIIASIGMQLDNSGARKHVQTEVVDNTLAPQPPNKNIQGSVTILSIV